jgi:L-serine dehydratase
MEFISIFNDVLGPVMRGPSSSHTAGSHRIGRIARSLLGENPVSAVLTFDPEGSYARTFREQGADLGFASGFLGWPMTDDRFPQALDLAARQGLSIEFRIAPLQTAEHPNTVEIELTGQSDRTLRVVAESTGGGLVVFKRIGGWPVRVTGKVNEVLIECRAGARDEILALLAGPGKTEVIFPGGEDEDKLLLDFQAPSFPEEAVINRIRNLSGVRYVWPVEPVFFVRKGEAVVTSAAEMVSWAGARGVSLGRLGLEYESELLGLSGKEARQEMLHRWDVMRSAVELGFQTQKVELKLIQPAAESIFLAESEGRLALGGPHARAAARAMAGLQTSNSGGVVCAAPTGASSGVIPGVLLTLAEENRLNEEAVALALFAAGAVGLVIARRATFAAEVAGCQVEIGAAGAMAAAAVVEAAGGTAGQALDAAAVSLQNSMGSVCDLVQGLCEIPCHTRNAAASSGAFICADLILGGYVNPVPLDETVDAAFSVGKMLPPELRCTSLGGLAAAPSARSCPRPK